MTATLVHPPRPLRRTLAVVAGALALACTGAQAQSHGGWHGGGGGGGWHGGGGYHSGWHGGYRGGWGFDPFWGFGLGLGLGVLAAPAYYDQPSVVYVNPPPVYYPPGPVYVQPAQTYVPQAPAVADPIFYPRNGQSVQQTEADRQDCNRWATTQPKAMADASIFQRATFACMDGRGYSAR